MSLAAALEAPRFFWTRHEVAGNGMSPEIVPTRIMSRSSGFIFARFKASADAAVQRSENFSPGETMCRSRMPVRSRIHWSDVSTIFSRSALVRSFLGTAPPVPTIFARFIGFAPPAGEPPSRARPRVVARVQLGDLFLDLLREVAPRELRREPNRVLDGLGRRS